MAVASALVRAGGFVEEERSPSGKRPRQRTTPPTTGETARRRDRGGRIMESKIVALATAPATTS